MAKRPSARWAGVIEFPQLGIAIDGGLYSSQRRGRAPLPMLQVHTACQTRLQRPVEAEEGEEEFEPEERREKERAVPTPATHPVHCPSCNRMLRADEVGRGVETEIGLILLSDGEYVSLKSEPARVVRATLKRDPLSVFATVGMGRRFYLLPKAHSIGDYYKVFTVLGVSGSVGFIQELVVSKRPYVVVVRPLFTHQDVFGEVCKVLVVDEFTDTDRVRSPKEYRLLPAEEPPQAQAAISELIQQAQRLADAVSPSDCVNPERRKFRELVAQKLGSRRVL